MTAFIVIGCILLLLLFIMLLPLKLFFQVENEDLSLHFGVLMFKFKLYPKEIKKIEKIANNVEQRAEKEQQSGNRNNKTLKSDILSHKKENNK